MSTHSVKSAGTPFNVVTGAGQGYRQPEPTASMPSSEAPSAPEGQGWPASEQTPHNPSMPGRLTQARLELAAQRKKRDATPLPAFPSSVDAAKGDEKLQDTLTHWVTTGKLKRKPIPDNASIKPYVDLYCDAVNEPAVQDWLASKGFKWSTVRIDRDGVEGIVIRDGVETKQRFTTSDGSGWWEVSGKVRAAVRYLSPSDLGILLPDPKTGDFNHVDVILDFYGVKTPNESGGAAQLGRQLTEDGWPGISEQKRTDWREQFDQLVQQSRDQDVRTRLAPQLQALVDAKAEDADLDLTAQTVDIDPQSSLAQKSHQPRASFAQFLATPAFRTFVDKIGFGQGDHVYRIRDGQLELRDRANHWTNLQAFLDDEISKTLVAGSAEEKARILELNANFNQLVGMSKETGDALYSIPQYDLRQVLEYCGLGSPGSVAQARVALGWLNNQLPAAPLAADYASLTPYSWGPGALSPNDLTVLRTQAAGPGSVTELLRDFADGADLPADPDLRLRAFFDSPQAMTKAQQLAGVLNMAEVAGGAPLSRASRHQLLAAAIKASVAVDVPGTPGVVAGYEIYHPSNLGRTINQVREEIETHLIDHKAVSARAAPLVAHLLLAQAAPEFLIKPTPSVSTLAPQALMLQPGQVTIGSTAWLNLRLGTAMAEKLGGAGSSRALTITQALDLSRLDATGPAQAELIKSLGAQPLLDWAVMAGIFPKSSDGRYSPGDYLAATQAFTDRENRTREAFNTLTSEPPTQTSLLVQQLAKLFPELTEDEIRNFKLELDTDVPFDPRQHGHLQTRQPYLAEVILTQQAEKDPLVAFGDWVSRLFGDEKKYKFIHPKISQETFNERIKNLPPIAPLVAPAVDQYIADTRSAQSTVIRLMIANAPLEVRRAFEVGKLEFFTLREETGQPVEDDQGEHSKVQEKKGRHGLLMRYETGATTPRFGYYEVFPGSMKMIRRDDLSYSLGLNGVTQKGSVPYGPFAFVQRDFRHAKLEKFDFQAYSQGTEPRPGVDSRVIIEKAREPLPGQVLSQWPGPAPVYVPNSWASTRTRDITRAVLDNTFEDKRELLLEYANQPTRLQKRRSYPFDSGKILTQENLRAVLSLIPFVGAVADIADGNIKDGLKGLLIDFASFAATGGLAAARSFFKGIKAVVPYSGRAFGQGLMKESGLLVRSMFNPLDGSVDVLRSTLKITERSKRVLSGELMGIGSGIYLPTTAFEKCRWGLGAYEALRGKPPADPQPVGQLGVSQQCAVYAVNINSKWYAINPATLKPTGAPLEDFTPESQT
ncbi:hypothetical protein [Pseudomonas sp. DTU12.1]|uniref:hypothetical protein n=1 Tax=Pseudomonas sp. DTU12.1 TaxID=2654238 RepID=UPI002115C5DD|nr:hypothetical protein [Pseudomonas sp. DTU12.1]